MHSSSQLLLNSLISFPPFYTHSFPFESNSSILSFRFGFLPAVLLSLHQHQWLHWHFEAAWYEWSLSNLEVGDCGDHEKTRLYVAWPCWYSSSWPNSRPTSYIMRVERKAKAIFENRKAPVFPASMASSTEAWVLQKYVIVCKRLVLC